MIRLLDKKSHIKMFSITLQNSCGENSVKMHDACRPCAVYKSAENLTGWKQEFQSTNKEPIQAAYEKPRFFYAGLYCTFKFMKQEIVL